MAATAASGRPVYMLSAAMPMYEAAKCGSIDNALRYCAIDSSNRPVFMSSSAYESYGFGSLGTSAMYFLNAVSAALMLPTERYAYPSWLYARAYCGLMDTAF